MIVSKSKYNRDIEALESEVTRLEAKRLMDAMQPPYIPFRYRAALEEVETLRPSLKSAESALAYKEGIIDDLQAEVYELTCSLAEVRHLYHDALRDIEVEMFGHA